MITLRDYQRAAVNAIYAYFEQHDGNPLIVCPTGSGKSVILAAFIQEVMQRWPSQRVMLLTHVKELIEQNHSKLITLWPQAPVGVYSAGLGSRDVAYPITFAGIQSVHAKAKLFGRIDLVVIDEAHLVNKSAEGMYRTFLGALAERNPALKVIGLTATPYRLKGGLLHVGDERLFTDVAYDVDILRLIDNGYLVPLVPKQVSAESEIDTSSVHTRAGEFVAKELEAAAEAGQVIQRAVDEIVRYGAERRSWLVFCVGVAHAEKVTAELRGRGINTALVTGATPAGERARMLTAYKTGTLRALVNVNVLTTGFDAPETDLLAVLRPTQSTGLWVQVCGRGMRPAEGKADCLVLDFGGNVARHGPIDKIEPHGGGGNGTGEPMVKPCPECATLVWIAASECRQCGYVWTVPCPQCESPVRIGIKRCDACGHDWFTPNHAAQASTDALLSTMQKPVEHHVRNVTYHRHQKEGKPDSLKVTYWCDGLGARFSEWVCIEHDAYARYKAEAWWMIRSGEPRELVPTSVDDAIELASYLRQPTTVLVKRNGKFDEVIGYGWDEDDAAAAHAESEGPAAGGAA